MTSQNESMLEEPEQFIGQKMTFGKVWSNLWGLIASPKKTIPRLKENDQIGWPLTVVYFVYLIITAFYYLINFLVAEKIGFDINAFFSLFTSEALLPSVLLIFSLLLFLILFLLGFWVNLFFWHHLLANIYGGRGKWWQLAIDSLYLQLLSAIITPIILLLSFITGFINNNLISLILILIINLASSVWLIFLFILVIRDIYRLATWRAIMAVLTPIIIFIIILVGIYFLFFKTKINLFERTPSSNSLNTSIIGNLNTNLSWDLGNLNSNINTNTAYDRIPSTKIVELSERESNERIQKVDRNLDYLDVRRQNELIALKYDLLKYYEVYKKFPVSQGTTKLDGQTDPVYLALKDFKTFYYGSKDPEHPKYYYGYQSDGQKFTLTAYLTSAKKIFMLTNE